MGKCLMGVTPFIIVEDWGEMPRSAKRKTGVMPMIGKKEYKSYLCEFLEEVRKTTDIYYFINFADCDMRAANYTNARRSGLDHDEAMIKLYLLED